MISLFDSRYDQWDLYAKELEDLNLSVENFTVSITIVVNKRICLTEIKLFL